MTTPIPPVVSVITPTWQRHKLLLDRALPAVQTQTYPLTEHVIVSDGPDPELSHLLLNQPSTGRVRILYWELPEHDPEEHWGAAARLAGIEHSSGEFITYMR